MCGDVVNVRWQNIRVFKRQTHCLRPKTAAIIDLTQVRTLGGVPRTDNLRVNSRSSRTSIFRILDYDHRRALGDDKAITQFVKRSAGFFRRSLPSRKNSNCVKRHNRASGERRFSRSGHNSCR